MKTINNGERSEHMRPQREGVTFEESFVAHSMLTGRCLLCPERSKDMPTTLSVYPNRSRLSDTQLTAVALAVTLQTILVNGALAPREPRA